MLKKVSNTHYYLDNKRISKNNYYKKTKTNHIKRYHVDNIDDLLVYDTIVVTGMSGMGKSTFSAKLDKKGYKKINNDEIIRKLSKSHKDGTKIFAIYHGKNKYPKVMKQVLDIVKLYKKKNKKVLFEGAIFDTDMLNKIKGKNGLMIYIETSSVKGYIRYLTKRVKYDIKNKTEKMSIIWKKLGDKQKRMSIQVKKIIEKLANKRHRQFIEDYKLFEFMDYVIVET